MSIAVKRLINFTLILFRTTTITFLFAHFYLDQQQKSLKKKAKDLAKYMLVVLAKQLSSSPLPSKIEDWIMENK